MIGSSCSRRVPGRDSLVMSCMSFSFTCCSFFQFVSLSLRLQNAFVGFCCFFKTLAGLLLDCCCFQETICGQCAGLASFLLWFSVQNGSVKSPPCSSATCSWLRPRPQRSKSKKIKNRSSGKSKSGQCRRRSRGKNEKESFFLKKKKVVVPSAEDVESCMTVMKKLRK